MSELSKMLTAAIGAGILLGATATQAQQASLKMTLFGQPSVNNDSIWMAFEKGYYQQEGLDVTYRLFPSGTTAFQCHLHFRERGSPMKNRKREICTSSRPARATSS